MRERGHKQWVGAEEEGQADFALSAESTWSTTSQH